MPIQKSRQSHDFVFEKSRAILLGVLIASSAALFLVSNIRSVEAAGSNWACTKVAGGGAGQTEASAIRAGWVRWRQHATAKCGVQCGLLKNATGKEVFTRAGGGGYRAKVTANACYYLPGIGSLKSTGSNQYAPTRLP